MIWVKPKIATWTAEVPVDDKGYIQMNFQQTVAGLKRFSVKGQNPLTTNETGQYGVIGEVFINIFCMLRFSSIARKVTEEGNEG